MHLQVYRDKDTYTDTLDSEAVRATRVQTVALDAKCNHKKALYRRLTTRLGTRFWAHFWAHSVRFSRGLTENGRKTSQGDGFLNRRLH